MKGHLYSFEIRHLRNNQGEEITDESPIIFNAPSHEDIKQILEKAKKNNLDENLATRFVIGLKLLGEVLLEDKDNPLFKELKPHFGEVMKIIKAKK